MPKGKRSPGVGHNSEAVLPNHEKVRAALALEVMDKERIAELTEARKRHRKSAEGQGVVLEDLDRLYKMRDMSPAEVEIWFRRQWNALGAIFTSMFDQLDLFKPKPSAPEIEAATRHMGFMAGLQGKAGQPPPSLVGAEHQLWMEGHGEGLKHRNAAKKVLDDEDAERLALLQKALDNAAAGQVTDGTTGEPIAPAAPKLTKAQEKARAEAARAAADFAKDNPGVAIPGAGIPGETTPPAPAGEEAAPASSDAETGTLSGGVQPAAADDGFEATEEELNGQAGRKALKEKREGLTSGEGEEG